MTLGSGALLWQLLQDGHSGWPQRPGSHRGGDRVHHGRRQSGLIAQIRDAAATRAPGEVGVGDPYDTDRVLQNQQPDRPVQTRVRIAVEELRPERWSSEY